MKLYTKKINSTILVGLLVLISIPFSFGQNILTNGGFESGGSGVGFMVHDYTLINPLTGTSNPGQYARTTNPNLMNNNYISGGDHTTGTGNMLVFDGANIGNKFFWTTGSTGGAIGGFTAGTTYTFSYWIKSVSSQVTDASSQANIGVFFVNANFVNPSSLNSLAPLPSEGWKKVSYSFVAAANNVMVRLKTINYGAIGNDFAVDDFSIVAGALPFSGSFTSQNPTCPNVANGSISVAVSGGFYPYSTYNLTGTSTQSNTTGIFTGLSSGTYAVSVSDSSGATYTQQNIVLAVPNDLVVSNPVTICAGESTTLTVSGGVATFAWTSSPNDASISNPNSPNQTVTPLSTTTYTVTSGTLSSPTNLVVNGDFSLGNQSFTTDYNQVANPNPFGVQSSYDIVTNPNAWFSAFSSCGDHTTGTGALLVADGSTDPSGTIRVWCNATPITVLPNKDYTFSYYIASVSVDNPAKIEAQINGVVLGTAVTAPTTTCQWTLQSFTWNSGTSTTAQICLFDKEFNSYGNDFALDDISLVEKSTCLYQKNIVVTVTPKTTPTFTSPSPICSGTSMNALPLTSLNGFTGTWLPILNTTQTTTYTFTPTLGQCSNTANLTVTVNPLPVFSITEGCNGANYTLSALLTDTTSTATFNWFDAQNNPLLTDSAIVITNPGLYKLKVTQNGCSNDVTKNVVSCLCLLQKGISPNNDTKNDYFDLATLNVNDLKIYNRYGSLVYNKAAYKNEWYGQTNSGSELPDGTYYYVIDIEGAAAKTGWIYINRQL